MSHLILTTVGGDPGEIVSLDDAPDLSLGSGDVLVAMEAAPINPADLAFQQGWFLIRPRVPHLLGAEGVGRTVRAGPAVHPSLVGRRVIVLPTFLRGTWGDEVVVRACDVLPVSEDGDAMQLAMLAMNPATAYALLHDYATVAPGQTIGLSLANSAVGRCIITLARRAGIATLAIVRRAEAARQVHDIGADRVVVDGDDLGHRVAEALGTTRLRALFDGGAPALAELTGFVEDGGTVVTYAAVRGRTPVLPLADLFRGVTLHGFSIIGWIRDTPWPRLEALYAELAELIEQHALGSTVEATYPLQMYRQAFAHAARPRHGKILFTPGRTAPVPPERLTSPYGPG